MDHAQLLVVMENSTELELASLRLYMVQDTVVTVVLDQKLARRLVMQDVVQVCIHLYY